MCLECIVQEAVVRRPHEATLALGALAGTARLLYVEISLVGSEHTALQTETGTLLQDGLSRAGGGHEIWVFGASAGPQEADGPSCRGERLVFPFRRATVLAVQVFRSYVTWPLVLGLRAPLDLVAEGQFRFDREGGSDVVVPLMREGCVYGEVSLAVRQHGNESSSTTLFKKLGIDTGGDTKLFEDADENSWDTKLFEDADESPLDMWFNGS